MTKAKTPADGADPSAEPAYDPDAPGSSRPERAAAPGEAGVELADGDLDLVRGGGSQSSITSDIMGSAKS